MEKIDYGLLTVLLLFFTGLLLLITAWLMFKHQAAAQDPARRIYDRFCLKLADIGFQHRPYEGPLDFADRVSLKKKVLAEQVNLITSLYIQVRYASHIDKLHELEKQVNIFRPKKLLHSLR
jgi:protein-glutamine gamma-glutamyltransferase